ncbi:hypothetical protein LCL95_04420 [Bacillus timonensis]|nr:hypothetical protein [Bacillus timonensis]
MSLEWFYRMENAVRNSLPDVCQGFDQFDILFDTDTTEQNPTFSFSIETPDDLDEFCFIHFDPTNQEFYAYHFDEVVEYHAKILFTNLDDILSYVHTAFHEYFEEFGLEYEDENDEFGEGYNVTSYLDEEADNIEWISNEKYIHIESNQQENNVKHAILYKMGIDQTTGEGVLFRNTISTEGGEDSEERVHLYFKEEEAMYMIDLLNDYVNTINKK